jgi:hypothetical protein
VAPGRIGVGVAEHLTCRVAAGPVRGEEQQRADPLAQRMPIRQRPQVGRGIVVAAECQQRVGPFLAGQRAASGRAGLARSETW